MSDEILNKTLPDLIQEFERGLLNIIQLQSHFILATFGVLRVFPLRFNAFSKHTQGADPLCVTLNFISTQ